MFIPFSEYAPDRPDYRNADTVASGVIPRTDKSYGPFPSLVEFSDALNARCQGAYAGRSKQGNVTHFAADASKLYKLTAANWGDVSKSGGYTTATDDNTEFAQYKDRVMATNFGDPVQSWVLDVDTAYADLSADAPQARHIAVIDPGFVIVGNTFDGVDGAVPNRVWWPVLGDPATWPTPGSSAAAAGQSDFNDMPSGGWVQKIVGAVGGANGLVLMDTSVYRIDYSGPPDVLQFFEIERARGTPAPQSVVNVGAFAAYLGEDDVYVCDGTKSTPVGANRIAKTMFGELDQNSYHRIWAVADPINKVVIWGIPTAGSGGNIAKVYAWNWQINRWAFAELNAEILYRSLTIGYTLEGLNSVTTDLEALTPSLDSRFWTGGRLLLSAFSTNHKQSNFTGPNMAAVLETGEWDSDSSRRLFIKGIRPIVNGGTVTAAIGYRDTPDGAVTYTTATSPGVDGICQQKIDTRFARARVSIASGGSWTHASGIHVEARRSGRR